MEDKHEMYRASVSLHKERVNKNPSRMEYVIKKFEEYGIKYEFNIFCFRGINDKCILSAYIIS